MNLDAAPLVLDLDRSTGTVAGAHTIDLADWQEAVRFGCGLRRFRRFARALEAALPATHGTVLMGSGDFHHLSWPLIARLARRQPARRFEVVVLDNHPDNMRFPFGIHCGSWVRRVAALTQVAHVHVVGITSADIGAAHAWENYLFPLLRGKLSYWCMDVDVDWARHLGLAHAFHRHGDPAALVAAFAARHREAGMPVYLSIDKDVFAPQVARTNWDQGRLGLDHALALIAGLRDGLVGSDINGEVSAYQYATWWKRKLSALDEQPAIDPAMLAEWQAQQHALNARLLTAIGALPLLA